MDVLKNVLFVIIGFVLLIKGADFFVDGSSSVARKLKVPSLVIGLTIVSIGTSLPELSVSAVAAYEGSNSLAISNVLGSNIFNLMVVLGASALLNRITVEKDVLRRDFPVSLISAAFLAGVGLVIGMYTRVVGIISLVLFSGYILWVIMSALRARKGVEATQEEAPRPWFLDLIFILGGVAAVKFGGDFVVDGSVSLAYYMGISETLVGLTIVSVGTSLPELVTSMVAAKKNELELAVGNAIGSNIFNLLLILGVSGTISPMSIISENIIDVFVLLGMSLLVYLVCIIRRSLFRLEGALMILIYGGYLAYIIVR